MRLRPQSKFFGNGPVPKTRTVYGTRTGNDNQRMLIGSQQALKQGHGAQQVGLEQPFRLVGFDQSGQVKDNVWLPGLQDSFAGPEICDVANIDVVLALDWLSIKPKNLPVLRLKKTSQMSTDKSGDTCN